ncbi:MAG: [Clostridia bacterium]|nr:[FeFe] hydrogenase H-cluster radical SAM maturase HydE [Clostridia bacterium]
MLEQLIEKLEHTGRLDKAEYLTLIQHRKETRDELAARACKVRARYYGQQIFIRGLIEISSFCKNNCYYCGLRAGNVHAKRYRLSSEEIISAADTGYALGFRTFVLQGGEDPFYTDEILVGIVQTLKDRYPDCAVTLSLGERGYESYRLLRQAGADRYLLRHETADPAHYGLLHPAEMSFERRMQCLKDLRSLGYQVGAGFMVGSPHQTEENLAQELVFLRDFRPEMVGIGPFLPHHDTPFAKELPGSVEMTCFLLSLIRLTLPDVLLPATTALGTADPNGREKGIMAGANVLMPNLSPAHVREKYLLYDGKICTGEEAAQCIECLKNRIRKTGCEIVTARGDCARTVR